MARPRAELPPAQAIRALADGAGRVAVRVTPGARAESLALGDGRLEIKVRAAPEAGKANAAVIALVARALGVAPSQVEMLRGATGRDKLIRI